MPVAVQLARLPLPASRVEKSNQVSATVVAGTDAATLQGFVTDRTEPDTMVCTDDAQAQMACQENAKRPSTASESL